MIVLGGSAGVLLVTTPRHALLHAVRRVTGLLTASDVNHQTLISEIVDFARRARRGGLLSIEPTIAAAEHPGLRHALSLAVDVNNHQELRSVLEAELHMAERQGEADAKTLEVAGGFAPGSPRISTRRS